jgi:hypothetical protein
MLLSLSTCAATLWARWDWVVVAPLAALWVGPGGYCPPRHVIERIFNPRFLSQMASDDVASDICPALSLGGSLGGTPYGSLGGSLGRACQMLLAMSFSAFAPSSLILNPDMLS